MLSLTKRTEYALIAASHLARARGAVLSARQIAGDHSVKLPLLTNVLKAMHGNGLVKSVRGVRGGYSLAMPPESISLSRLIRAVEGPFRMVRCTAPPPDGDPGCGLLATCPIRRPVVKVHERLQEFMDGITVADVAFDEEYGRRWAGPLHELKVISL
jgi:Rrf2 family protein